MALVLILQECLRRKSRSFLFFGRKVRYIRVDECGQHIHTWRLSQAIPGVQAVFQGVRRECMISPVQERREVLSTNRTQMNTDFHSPYPYLSVLSVSQFLKEVHFDKSDTEADGDRLPAVSKVFSERATLISKRLI